MSWQTQFARRLFPRDQKFMAKRKLRVAIWTIVMGLLGSAVILGLLLWTQSAH
jgi:cell division septal protein FtsQ